MLETKTVGKPCAGKPHARFDEDTQICGLRSSDFTLLDKYYFVCSLGLRYELIRLMIKLKVLVKLGSEVKIETIIFYAHVN